MNKEEMNIAKVVGCEVLYFERFSDGFSFCVYGELEAYKSAYAYRRMKNVRVSKTAFGEEWLVQVYK